jgi:hypothetical protein
MGLEEEEGQAREIHNVFNKIIIENFPNLKNVLPIQVQKDFRIQTELNKIEPPHGISSSKQA